jgi:hypothetical protein
VSVYGQRADQVDAILDAVLALVLDRSDDGTWTTPFAAEGVKEIGRELKEESGVLPSEGNTGLSDVSIRFGLKVTPDPA